MKKYLFTISFVAAFALISQAQSDGAKPAKKEKVNPDGTMAPATTAPANEVRAADNKSQPNDAKPAGKRMAITEKGVPASKSNDGAKDQKATEPKKEAAPAKEHH
jgi:hypothetical protein